MLGVILSFLLIGFFSCTHDRSVNSDNFDIDTDGDGIMDQQEISIGTDKDNPCDPAQNSSYTSYDPLNILWSDADCDNDGISNSDELSNATNPYFNESLYNPIYAIPEFLPTLSEIQLFEGNLSDLNLNTTVQEYSVSTPLFIDYSYRLRAVAIPNGEQMEYNGEGLLLFPDNTILAETIFYYNDERDPDLGKKIIETRMLIKINGQWNLGKYLWNDEQTEAFLDEGAQMVQIDWIDDQGNDRNINYRVLPNTLCTQCHSYNGNTTPIGPKSRALNFVYKGNNQIQYFIDNGILTGAPDVSQIAVLPDWSDTSQLLEDRARAYLDVNCAHCHQPAGTYNINYGDSFEFRFETSFEDSNIYDTRVAIQDRMNTQIPSYFMPLIGTTVIHTEGTALIDSYIESMD